MIRTGISIVIALSILFAMTAGVCLACNASGAKMPACCQSNHCKMPKRTAGHVECSAPPVDFSKVTKPPDSYSKVVAPAVDSIPAAVPLMTAHMRRPVPEQRVAPYLPPDLCLLNSVFNV